MKTIKYFFVGVLYLSILGCQSCKKDQLPPEPVKIFHTVTVTTADGVTISPSGSMKIESGKSIGFDLNSALNKRYQILLNGVAVTGYLSGSNHYQTPGITADANIQIMSEVVTFTVTASAGTGGTVTPNGATVVEYGKDLTLTPVEDAGYTLTAIKVNGVSVPVVKPYTLNVTANSEVKFEFTLTNFLILSNGADDKSRAWMWTHWDVYDENHVWEASYLIHQEQLAEKNFFYTNGGMVNITAAGVVWGPYPWVVNPDGTLKISQQIYTIVEISDKKIVYEQKGEFTLGKIEYMRDTYERQ